MESAFNQYRMKDGRTPLSEAFFNPVFKNIDQRLILNLKKIASVESRVNSIEQTVTNQALAVVNQKMNDLEDLIFAGV
jgi:hypothetical protein